MSTCQPLTLKVILTRRNTLAMLFCVVAVSFFVDIPAWSSDKSNLFDDPGMDREAYYKTHPWKRSTEISNLLSHKTKYQGASLQVLTKRIRDNPGSAQNYTELADAQSFSGDQEAAIPNYTKAISLDPTLISPYIGRSKAYEASNQPQLALKDATFALPRSKGVDNVRAIAQIASINRSLHKYNETIAAYTLLLKHPLVKDDWKARSEIYSFRGEVKTLMHKDQEAVGDCELACQSDPGGARFLRELADAYLRVNLPAKAIPIFNDLIARQSRKNREFVVEDKLSLLLNARAKAYKQLGKISEANKDIAAAVHHSSDVRHNLPFQSQSMRNP